MRTITTLSLLLLFCNYCQSQIKSRYEIATEDSIRKNAQPLHIKHLKKLVSETKDIMQILNIPIRNNINLDGKIKFYAWDLKTGMSAIWHPVTTADYELDSTQWYYPESWILIRPKEAEWLKQGKKSFNYLKIRSIIVHELTHYFEPHRAIKQAPARNRKEGKAHINLSIEITAQGVEGYYFLKRKKPELIQPILTTPPIYPWLIRVRLWNNLVNIWNPDNTFEGE